MLTPVIVGSSGWVASGAQHFLSTIKHKTNPPLIFGSKEGWSHLCNVPVHKLSSCQTVINRLPSSGPLVVFHLAYLTQEKVGQNQQRYIQAIDKINEKVSSIVSNNDVAALIYASSGAARISYDSGSSSAGKSLYGRLKARDEISFGDLCGRHGTFYLAPRIFSLAGPYINKPDAYAISNMIKHASSSGLIKILAERPVWRSYVDVIDLIEVLWGVAVHRKLNFGQSAIFDVVHNVNLEMGDLALAVASHFQLSDTAVERPIFNHGVEPDYYIGAGDQFRSMAWQCGVKFFNLSEMVARTTEFLRRNA